MKRPERRIVVFLSALALLAFGSMAEAQTATAPLVDYWASAAECMAAQGAPFYYPSALQPRKLGSDETVRGHPTGGCFDMDLPDRMGGRGFVRIEAGRRFVYNRMTGRVIRLAECNNNVYGVVPFPPLRGISGPIGPRGPRGEKGEPGLNGAPAPEPQGPPPLQQSLIVKKHSSKKWWVIAGVGGAIAGYSIWYYWPCPCTVR